MQTGNVGGATVPVRRVEDGAAPHAVHGGEDGVTAANVAQRGATQVPRADAELTQLDDLLRGRLLAVVIVLQFS